MKPFIVNEKTWHCWVAKQFGGLRINRNSSVSNQTDAGYQVTTQYSLSTPDMCSYVGRVIKGLLLGAFILWLILMLTFPPLAYLLHFIFTHAFGTKLIEMGKVFGIIELCVAILIIGAIAVMGVNEYFTEILTVRKQERAILRAQRGPGFIKQAYASVRGKFCIPVKLENNIKVTTETYSTYDR